MLCHIGIKFFCEYIIYLEVYLMHVFEEEEQEAAVVHLLAELGQGDVALLLAVRAEQEGGDGDQVLTDILLGLLLVSRQSSLEYWRRYQNVSVSVENE